MGLEGKYQRSDGEEFRVLDDRDDKVKVGGKKEDGEGGVESLTARSLSSVCSRQRERERESCRVASSVMRERVFIFIHILWCECCAIVEV